MQTAFLRRFPAASALLAAALLPACKSVEVPKVPGVTPYRMVIQQGNFISQEMVAQLKPGMTREQVRYVLGTPLVADIFHADRWDYVFFRELPNGKREQRNLSVVFEKDKLARVLGDLMPPEATAPQATGFEPMVKPESKPAPKPEPEAPKAAAEAAKPAEEAPKPAADAAPASAGGNWRSTYDDPEKKAEPAPKPEPAAAKEEDKKPAEEPKERGFFGRMLEKIGL
jgi:outer membrane protein assembly factor BamE